MTDEMTQKTQETAKRLFAGGIKMEPPYLLWKAFDRELANDFSRFITGNLYSRTVLSPPERQMVACSVLAAIRARDELKLHVNAALNVGCDRIKLAELFFQIGTYAGMPAVNEALAVYRDVLTERGEWPLPNHEDEKTSINGGKTAVPSVQYDNQAHENDAYDTE